MRRVRCTVRECRKASVQPISKAELDSTLGESAPSFTTVKYWVAEFKRGRTSCRDEHRSGRPNEVTAPEMVKKIYKMIVDDRRLKVRELADMIGIPKSPVHRILTENLDMRKLCARWVPRLLAVKQKQRREDVSVECLAVFHRSQAEFSRRFITMDETWVHHYTPEAKEQSKQWTERGESAPKKAKTVPTAGKVMASVFWDARGIILIDYLQRGKTINGEYYANLLQRLSEEIKEKRPQLATKKALLHQDNAPVHTSVITMAKINELKFELLPHAPYSPDLTPSDYFLFPNLKKWLGGKRCANNEEVESAVHRNIAGKSVSS
ncbi:histone-lysine N-methyltransferase SETMAR-like [Andrena cerasifolii]|uniref:histone-lysine N-methyltransferase SETMAR-like n=1 Tax=Andrena cerasifolii TaxID=2819439 RepID=UPI00403821CA